MMTAIVAWLATYALHSSVLLGAVYLLERARVLVELDVRESGWRLAMFAPLVTAALHVGFASGVGIDIAERRSESAVAASVTNPTRAPAKVGNTPIEPEVASPAAHSVDASPNRPDETAGNPVLARSVRVPFMPPLDLVAVLWMSAAGLGIGLLAWQFSALRRRFRAAPSCRDRVLIAEATEIANKAGVSIDAIKQFSGEKSTALVIPPATLCVPDWAVADLKPPHRRAMIAHEVAHILRGDPWWRLSYRALSRALFIQPLNWLALRKLDEIAELACDRWAAENADRRALVECLVICGERIVAVKPSALASAMAASNSTLLARVQSLFAMTPRLGGRVVAARSALVLLLIAVLSLPVLIFETTAVAADEAQRSPSGPWSDWSFDSMRGTGVRIQSGSGLFDLGPKVTTMKVTVSGVEMGARFRGDVEFSAAEDRVIAINGSLVIEEKKGAVVSRIEVDKVDGAIRHRYRVDGKERPFEPEGRLFFAHAMPIVLRESAFDAEARVDRILKRGVDALFAEVDLMHHDFARRIYLSKLLKNQQLSPEQVARTLDLTAAMNSDFEKRVLLRRVAEQQSVEGANLVKMLDTVTAMDSDFEQRVVLTLLTSQLAASRGDPAVVQAWSKAVATIDSDFEGRLAIVSVTKGTYLDPALAEAALRAVVKVDSDFEARVILEALAAEVSKTPALVPAYLAASDHIDSDFEKRLALTRLVKAVHFDTVGFKAVVESTADIDSKFECQVLLRALFDQLPADASAIDLYRNASKRCGVV